MSAYVVPLYMSTALTVDRKPLVLVLAFWELHDLAQTSSSKCGLRILTQLVAAGSLSGISWSELIASSLVAVVSSM